MNTQKIEINWLKRSGSHLCEIYSQGLQYCFISDKMEQCHQFVFCKDFLQDAVQAFWNDSQASIYGFSYSSKNPPICQKKTRIALANQSDKSFLSRAESILDFINQFAKRMHLKKSKIYEVSNPPKKYKSGVLFVEGSQRWINNPPMLSMYSLLLRCGGAHTVGNDCMDTVNKLMNGKIKCYGANDASYLKSALGGIKKILSLGYRPFFYIEDKKNYPKVDIGTMHGSAGIVGFSSGYSKSVCRYWHRKSLEARLKELEKGDKK